MKNMRNRNQIENFYVWDGINSQLEGFDTIKECEEYITDTCTDENEGIHPDIESMIIMKPVREVLVNEYKDNYKVEFKNI